MIATILSFTTIHIGAQGPEAAPYAVVIAEAADGSWKAARADGDLSWIAIDAAVEIDDGADGMRALPVVSD